MSEQNLLRYTARTPGGAARTGAASEIAAWLQEQDWDWGKAGADGALPWRRAVAARMKIQTGRAIEPAALEAEDAEAFLKALSAAGLITLDKAEVGKAEVKEAESGKLEQSEVTDANH